jgi:hypothetical protein
MACRVQDEPRIWIDFPGQIDECRLPTVVVANLEVVVSDSCSTTRHSMGSGVQVTEKHLSTVCLHMMHPTGRNERRAGAMLPSFIGHGERRIDAHRQAMHGAGMRAQAQ